MIKVAIEKSISRNVEIPEWMLIEHKHDDFEIKKSNIKFLKNTLNEISKVMRNEIFSERFAMNGEFIQKIDPRVKLLTLLLFMIFCGLTRSIVTLIFLSAIAILYVKFSGLVLRDYFKRVWLILPLIVLIFSIPAATNIFIKGKALFYIYQNVEFEIWFIKFPREIYFSLAGIGAILKMVMRIGVSFSYGYLLVMTTRWAYLTEALKVLKIPSLVISILNMTFRYIYVLSKIAGEMIEARFLRTVGHTDNNQNRNFIAGRISFLFVKSGYLSDEIFDSMKCRGYTGESVVLKTFKIQRIDILWIINNLIIIFILGIGEILF
jgi:cobalt/nickel transport system permease protein